MAVSNERRVVSQLVASVPVGDNVLNSELCRRSGSRVTSRHVAYFTSKAKCMRRIATAYQAGVIENDDSGANKTTLLYKRECGPGRKAEYCIKQQCEFVTTCLIAMAAQHLDNLRFADPYMMEASDIYLSEGSEPIHLKIPE